MSYSLPSIRFVMVRERGPEYESRPALRAGTDAIKVFRDYLGYGRGEEPAVEVFVAAYLSVRHKVIALHTISTGCLTSSLVHPREVFAPALTLRASAIVLAHNHPSGDPEPSAEDISLTRRLAQGGCLMGIEVLDHVVLGDGRAVSLHERGVI